MAKKIKTPAEMHGTAIKTSTGSKIFDVCNTIFLLALRFVTLYPMWYVICASFTNNVYLVSHPGAVWWPVGFTTGSYKMAFQHPLILSGYKNILLILGISLPINIIMTLFCGYFLASKGMMFKGPIQFLIMFTMFFGGGMIPTYLNIRDLGLYNSLWALILPGMISVYNSIICRTAIEGVPESLKESAYIDGANDLVIFFHVMLPLQSALLATFTLFTAVGYWNEWFWSSLVLIDRNLWPMQLELRQIMWSSSAMAAEVPAELGRKTYAEGMKAAAVIVTMLPIMCIYPFLQKYFAKGVMIGAIKS